MAIQLRLLTTVAVFVCLIVPNSSASILNGDFQNGLLSPWQIQEDFAGESTSVLAKCEEISPNQFVGTLTTGYNTRGIYVVSLLQQNLTIPGDALELVFDYQLIDRGADTSNGNSSFVDQLSVSLLSDKGDVDPILSADKKGETLASKVIEKVALGNGYFRVKTDVAALAGSMNTSIIFDLYDEDDGRLTMAHIDNVAFIIPEPVSIATFIVGSVLLCRKRGN